MTGKVAHGADLGVGEMAAGPDKSSRDDGQENRGVADPEKEMKGKRRVRGVGEGEGAKKRRLAWVIRVSLTT